MEISFDLEQLTIGDLEDLEDICGKPYEELDFTKPNAKMVKAMVYLSERRRNPDFTIDDARGVKLADVTAAANPTPDGGDS